MALTPILTGNPETVRTDLGAIFVSLELSRATWLVTSLSPASGGRMSRHTVRGGDVSDLLSRFAHLQTRAYERTGTRFPLVIIHEARLDRFWIHRILEQLSMASQISPKWAG